jgi:Tfp pilus assembly protein PilV
MVYHKNRRGSQAGITLIEVMMSGAVLVIGSLSMIALIIASMTTNNRNRIDSTQTMLAEAIIEKVNSTLIGQGTTQLTDCAGTTYTVDTIPGGANLNAAGNAIDFTENIAADSTKTYYHMSYTVSAPCNSTGIVQGVYDVRWNVQKVGGSTNPTNSYILTVSSELTGHGEGNRFFSAPVTLRVMSGN